MKNTINYQGKRLLICSIGIPHPSKGASLVLFYHYIDGLRRMGFSILHLLLLQPGFDQNDLKSYIADISANGNCEVLHFEAKRFYTIRRFFPKVLIAQLPSYIVRRVNIFRANTILCFDIIAASVFDRAFGDMPNKIIWLGDLNFETVKYHALYDIKENFMNIIHFPAYFILSKLWKAFYKKILRRFKTVVVSSKSSEASLGKLCIRATYLPYPWPVKMPAENVQRQTKSIIPTFLFFGNLTGLGSRSAFHFLIRDLYPELLKFWGRGGFEIFICGMRELPGWIKNTIADKKEIRFLGFVEDVVSLIQRCHAVLVPIEVPVGNRSRILTAFAADGIVIAHSNAALGNPGLRHGENCYLAGNAGEFAACMQESFQNSSSNENIKQNAREFFIKNFSPEAAVSSFVQTCFLSH